MEMEAIKAAIGMKPYYEESGKGLLYCGDCLELMKQIPDKSIDLVLTDPPYGITACDWDKLPDFTALWAELKRIGKNNCAYVFTASQPFTTDLINSNRDWFKYEWIWNKEKGGLCFLAKYQPIKVHENILVFAKEKNTYNPIMEKSIESNRRPGGKLYPKRDTIIGNTNLQWSKNHNEEIRFPKSIINVKSTENECNNATREHPTQKPLQLMSYLIKTYSNENDTILDPFLGSGTTAVAAKKLGRRFIGIEISEKYCAIAKQRLAAIPDNLFDEPKNPDGDAAACHAVEPDLFG